VPNFPPLLLYSHPSTGELFRRRWFLEVIDGSDQGTVAEIDHSPALIGAAPASALLITDDTVSRYHAEVEPFAEGVRLRDLDSTNGSFIGEDRVRDAFLENDEEFRVGRTTVRVRAEDESAASEIDTDPRGVPPGAVEEVGHALAVAGVSRELLRLVRKIAPSSSAVLFEGPGGSGKATLARLLHDLSPRKAQPFVSFAPRTMIDETEAMQRLFGRGSKTASPRPSLFENAKGGTLFIEDIAHLHERLQLSLLNAIERGEIQRDADDRKIRIDVRLVSSTSKSLSDDPRFSRALEQRVAVVRLPVPSLRERKEDVRALAERFYEQVRRDAPKLGVRALTLLENALLPGNLDQLRVLIGALAVGDAQRPTDENQWGLAHTELTASLRRAFIEDVLAAKQGHVGQAAEDLRMTQLELFRFCQKHDVDLEGTDR
jgi:DNA-binding NtrC family response regulator